MHYHLSFDLDFKKNSYPGTFIVIEGIDGSGKTLQVNRMAQVLAKKHTVYLTKNPTDGPIGKLIRQILRRQVIMPSSTLQYLFSADRHVQQAEILTRLKKGEVVIADRYFWSAVAYGLVDLEDKAHVPNKKQRLLVTQGILSFYDQFIVPDHTFFLEIPVATAIHRLKKAVKHVETYENKAQLMRIREGYHWLLKEFPRHITPIDGAETPAQVTREILNTLALERL